MKEITDQMKPVALGVPGSLANSNEWNQGGYFEVDFDTSTLNTDDLRASNDPKLYDT